MRLLFILSIREITMHISLTRIENRHIILRTRVNVYFRAFVYVLAYSSRWRHSTLPIFNQNSKQGQQHQLEEPTGYWKFQTHFSGLCDFNCTKVQGASETWPSFCASNLEAWYRICTLRFWTSKAKRNLFAFLFAAYRKGKNIMGTLRILQYFLAF